MPGGGMTTTASIPPKVRWLIATVLTVFGGTALAVGLGVIPLPPEKALPNITVLSVASLLGQAIKRIHRNESVSMMFQ